MGREQQEQRKGATVQSSPTHRSSLNSVPHSSHRSNSSSSSSSSRGMCPQPLGWSIRGPPDLDGGGGGEGPLHPFVRPRRALGRSQSQQARDDARPSFRGNFLGTLCYRTNPPFTLQRISCIDPSTNTRFSVAPHAYCFQMIKVTR